MLDTRDSEQARAAFADPEVAAFARLDCVIEAVDCRVANDAIDMGLFQDWLANLKKARGADIFSVRRGVERNTPAEASSRTSIP